jgi:MoaA/NifB/PqqE/SkfB family radical SAM enzyme
MSSIIDTIRELFTQKEPLSPGFYSYVSPPTDPLNYRLHLRIEPDGSGLLIINAATVLHLNQTATEYAYHIVKQTPPDEIAREIARRYRIDRKTALKDYTDLKERIDILIATPDLDPVSYLDFDRHVPYSDEVSAPYRLDCALTYRLPEGSSTDAAPTKRVDRELNTEEWKQIIHKAWDVGIPHILFTGGEPTLREDLPDLLQEAEDLGMVTGLLTDGQKLADANYLNTLLQAGLDHAMIILQPSQDTTWEALSSFSYWAKTLEEDIYVAAHLTITPDNAPNVSSLVDRLAQTDISAVSLSTQDSSLNEALNQARQYVNELDIPLVWDLPVPYSNANPVNLELEGDLSLAPEEELEQALGLSLPFEDEERPHGAGRGWLYVEPDGDVLPSQGINKILGNYIRDTWEHIWNNAQELSK